MKYKNYLGDKKTNLSISVSKSIKNYLERYQLSMLKTSKDERFKNLSVFINNILEICINFFSFGNGLDELAAIKNIPKKEVSDFFRELLVGVNPYQYEESVKLDKYQPIGKLSLNTYAIYRNFVLEVLKTDYSSVEGAMRTLKFMGTFLLKNKLTERFDTYTQGDELIVEYRGFYSNIHFIYSKGLTGLIGYFGLRLREYYYEDKYTRFVFEITPLAGNKKFSLKERKDLCKYNTEKFTSLNNLLEDDKVHLWIDISKSNNSIISFKDYVSGMKIISNYLDKLEKVEIQKNFRRNEFLNENILKLFSSLNWISIKDRKNHELIVNIKEEDHPIALQIMKNIFKKFQLQQFSIL